MRRWFSRDLARITFSICVSSRSSSGGDGGDSESVAATRRRRVTATAARGSRALRRVLSDDDDASATTTMTTTTDLVEQVPLELRDPLVQPLVARRGALDRLLYRRLGALRAAEQRGAFARERVILRRVRLAGGWANAGASRGGGGSARARDDTAVTRGGAKAKGASEQGGLEGRVG